MLCTYVLINVGDTKIFDLTLNELAVYRLHSVFLAGGAGCCSDQVLHELEVQATLAPVVDEEQSRQQPPAQADLPR